MRYKVNIHSNEKSFSFEANNLSPAVIKAYVDIDYKGGDFVVDGEAIDKYTGETLDLSADGTWCFERKDVYEN